MSPAGKTDILMGTEDWRGWCSGPPVRVGKSAVTACLDIGKSSGDSIAQAGVDYSFGLIRHLTAWLGYVYVDGRHPIQAHGLNVFVRGYLFDSLLDLYAEAACQLYFEDDFGAVFTFSAGTEYQFPFGLFICLEYGAELEGQDTGYLFGAAAGFRF